jgi:hypothetical protein
MFSTEKACPDTSRAIGILVEGAAMDTIDMHRDDVFFAAVQKSIMPMVITDPRLRDNPIVFANAAFALMTRYDAQELARRLMN